MLPQGPRFGGQLVLPTCPVQRKSREFVHRLYKYSTKIPCLQAHANAHFPLVSGDRKVCLELEFFPFARHVCGKA